MFHLKIATPEKIIFNDNVESITFQTDEGEQTILTGHGPFIGKTAFGEIRLRNGVETVAIFAVDSGFYEFVDNTLSILVSHAVHLDEIETEKSEETKRVAMNELSNAREDLEVKQLQIKIKRADLHISLAKKYKS